jgi:glycosyltransferase involved in cell wall biosynthesis
MDFVSFSLNYWDDLWQSRHQIMLALAQKNKVLFVSPPFSLRQVMDDFSKGRLPKSGLVHRQANLYTLVFPKWLCETHRFPRLARFAKSWRQRLVRRAARKLGFRETVLFIWHPNFAELVGTIGESICCYYADDEFASYAEQTEAERKRISEQEDHLLKSADIVFANGPALTELKNRYGNVFDVPMTADFELFSRSRLAETPVPGDLEDVPHPRIAYIGNVNDKVDFDLILKLSVQKPEWSFVLVGPLNVRSTSSRSAVEQLQKQSNVFFLGCKPREDLPNYIKGVDVCMMCYRKDGWAFYVYPLKLHEYLASGKPIVGSGLKSLRDFENVVHIADSQEEWVTAIQQSLNEHDPALAARRVDVAYENRLERRIEMIENTLRQKLDLKGTNASRN